MYSNDYQTNTPVNTYAQGTGAQQYEKNVTEAVAGPSLALAHQAIDAAIERVQKAFLDLNDTAERTFGPSPKAGSTANVRDVPQPSGTLPGLIQKFEWLHVAIAEVEQIAHRFRPL